MTVFVAQFRQENQVGYLRIRSLSKDFSFLIYTFFKKLCLNISPSRMIVFIFLTTISSSDVFTDKNHIASRLNHVNVPGLIKLLRSEIFVNEDRQLRAVHLILDYKPMSGIFQDVGQAIVRISALKSYCMTLCMILCVTLCMT